MLMFKEKWDVCVCSKTYYKCMIYGAQCVYEIEGR
jgi:hypothetical protein